MIKEENITEEELNKEKEKIESKKNVKSYTLEKMKIHKEKRDNLKETLDKKYDF